ncbi:methionine synthase [Corynebacterium kutscheri]|uniref:Methionine synthase n=1 Tax=Corynebacterium kutscheri TaxID=35755 RepID=A0A0F6TDI8_9CORY|nr:methionine synthase [Corynebacterium kutscheri]AKE41226.1 methionine synthase (B12-dependent) [Corynebacterium kutscheri]VEH08502.1 methionine synthase [Corynebacterium kutscheri]VEH09548.1 methionine synthase [Corynebacterium kutscheri]VEH79631.1 methionine synthase [Corynebacterium kutscheri]
MNIATPTLKTDFLDALTQRVLIGDGAMGTQLQCFDLDIDNDFLGYEGCNEILNVTRPDVIAQIHRAYFEAGADLVETNTFGCNLSNLADYGIAHRCQELAYNGVAIARRVADELGPGRAGMRRFVVASIGPGTKLPSLKQIAFNDLKSYYFQAALGMVDGGADAILIETAQDLLQVKAAVHGCQEAFKESGVRLPLICHVTVEATGTMLLGTEIGAALTALEPLGIDMIGLNCATGPDEMNEHLRYLSQHASIPISVMPNAGLPVLGENGATYPLDALSFAQALKNFVEEYQVAMVGGCCGTTPTHISAARDAVINAVVTPRKFRGENAVSSLYTLVPLSHDTGITIIGERTNAHGSTAFRKAMLANDWQNCLDIAKQQTRDGAHMLDLCVDYVGRNGQADMAQLASLLATSSTLPIMLDSTEPEVIRTGLEQLGGRCAVNSVNFEDGNGPDSRYQQIMQLVKKHGAVVVALTIDEEGQARTAEKKLAIAHRLIADITGTWGLKESDIIVDMLTFPISTGQEETRRDGVETIAAIRELKKYYPQVRTILGISNISFGLNPAARQVLNSVFLHECVKAGLDSAIAHSATILPMNRIDNRQREVALDMIYDRRNAEYDPLQTFMALFDGISATAAKDARSEELAALPLFKRLAQRIIDGEKVGIEADLDAAMVEKTPLAIINEDLLAGMKTVGDLFGSGHMQLPFVLQSAETMKYAVSYLKQFLKATDNSDNKGTIVIATVKGDVHDIGKNLVDIILSNNGFTVVNIGIKQPITNILAAAKEHNADAIGMSGLLVKSTVIMKENLQAMNNSGNSHYPVMLGGAALTRSYVEDELTKIYDGEVYYARDAFESLRLMNEFIAINQDKKFASSACATNRLAQEKQERTNRRARNKKIVQQRKTTPNLVTIPTRSCVAEDFALATPPFWGTRIIKGIALKEYLPLLDERALFLGRWGLKPTRGKHGSSYEQLVETDGRPRLRYWIDHLKTEGILDHAALVYGYFPAVSEGDDVIILAQPHPDAQEIARIKFPRQRRGKFLCIADFIRSKELALHSGNVDVLPLQLVTMGQPIADFTHTLFSADKYRDYLEVHGISVQLTEALAEYCHARVRSELRFADGSHVNAQDTQELQKFFDLDYLGARYSFGYGSCPNLEDRAIVVNLLAAQRIGVVLSEEFQLHPEQSTDAFVLYHPEAKYFNT